MSPPPSPVDNSTRVGSVHASDQDVELAGVVTHTRSRAVRAPWWAVLVLVQLAGGNEALVRLLEAILT